jgi:hypothetical protein
VTQFSQRVRTRRFAVSLTVVLLLGVVVGTVIGTSRRVPILATAQAAVPLVTSATSAIRVVALQQTTIGNSPILNISLQNISPKTIKAYSIGSGKAWVTKSYYFSETAFAPNAIETQIIPLDSTTFRAASREFTVTGVLFEDGSTDGQAVSVFRLRENWIGLKDYMSQLLPCLSQLPSTLAAQDEAALVHCENEAGRWAAAKGRSSDYEDGFQNAQRVSLSELNEIKTKIHSGDFSDAAKQRDKIVRISETLKHR